MEAETKPGHTPTLQTFHTLRGVQDLDPDDIAILVIVEDDTGFILIALLNGSTPQLNGKHIHFLVILYNFL